MSRCDDDDKMALLHVGDDEEGAQCDDDRDAMVIGMSLMSMMMKMLGVMMMMSDDLSRLVRKMRRVTT